MKRATFLKNNRGFTLIELLIVMVIIALFLVGTVLGVGVLGYGNTKSAASRIRAVSDNVRIQNMTKKEGCYLVIYKEDKDYFLRIETERDGTRVVTSTERLDLRKGNISFQSSDGNRYLVSDILVDGVNVSEKLELTYAKDTGKFVRNSMGILIKNITVECNDISYRINLVEATGKAYID